MASAAVEGHRRRLEGDPDDDGEGLWEGGGRGCRWSSGRRRRERNHRKVNLRNLALEAT
jgi:hypothetical protein